MDHSVIPRARNEVVRMWQALLEERVIYHGNVDLYIAVYMYIYMYCDFKCLIIW